MHSQSFEMREVVVSVRSSFEHSFGHLQDLLLLLLLVLEKSNDVRHDGLVREGKSRPLQERKEGKKRGELNERKSKVKKEESELTISSASSAIPGKAQVLVVAAGGRDPRRRARDPKSEGKG